MNDVAVLGAGVGVRVVSRVAFAVNAANDVRREAGHLEPPVDGARGPSGPGDGRRGRLDVV